MISGIKGSSGLTRAGPYQLNSPECPQRQQVQIQSTYGTCNLSALCLVHGLSASPVSLGQELWPMPSHTEDPQAVFLERMMGEEVMVKKMEIELERQLQLR